MEGIDYESRDSTNFARANLKRIRNSIDIPFQKLDKSEVCGREIFLDRTSSTDTTWNRVCIGRFAQQGVNGKRVVDGMHGRSGIERSKIGHDTVTQKPGPLDIPPR